MSTHQYTFPEDPERLAVVIADTDDDSPRLAYADWLEKNGDPHRAEFIRVQCALADCSPADPDYYDLVDRAEEVIAALHNRDFESPLPAGFRYGSNLGCSHKAAYYQRGFPHTFGIWIYGLGRKEVAQLPRRLAEVMETNTVRELECAYLSKRQQAELLHDPVAAKLRGLIMDVDNEIQAPPEMPQLRRLCLMGDASDHDVKVLAKADFEGLTYLRFHPECRVAELEKLMIREWFLRLRTLHVRFTGLNARVGSTHLAALRQLHSLRLWGGKLDSVPKALAGAGEFSSLAHLDLSDVAWTDERVADLARARFPRLSSLSLTGDLSWSMYATLIGADWLGGLRRLSFPGSGTTCGHGSKGLQALAKRPCAKNLRNLHLAEADCDRTSLALVGERRAFPSLTGIEIGSPYQRKATATGVVRFLREAHLPRLRTILLGGWPLGEAGAIALATNPTFANLTGLRLQQCSLGSRGVTRLLRSPNLQNLVHFELWGDDAATAAEVLCDPEVLPDLGHGHLHGDNIPEDVSERLYSLRMI